MRIRLREWRNTRKLSLRRLAEEAGVHWTTIHRIERGKISPTVAMLAKVAKALDIAVRDLFPITDVPKPRRQRNTTR